MSAHGMQRKLIKARPDWIAKNAAQKLFFHNNADGSPYWGEGLVYEIPEELADRILKGAQEIHNMCLKAVDHILASDELLRKLHIPESCWVYARKSWEEKQQGAIGRFDIGLDENGVPKLFEYNADTPTTILEAGIVQQKWAEEVYPSLRQANTIHSDLVARWKEILPQGTKLYVASVMDHEEDFLSVDYLKRTAEEAGFVGEHIHIETLGWNGEFFISPKAEKVETLFKLYPWEWLTVEPFAEHLYRVPPPIRMIEPPWKMVLSNKGLLPILWSLFPNHPNLLPAFWTKAEAEAELGKHYVEKPLLGREGQNVSIYAEQGTFKRGGEYVEDGFVYQKVCMPPQINGNYFVVGVWVIGNKASGLCVREEKHPIIVNQSMFVPHIVVPNAPKPAAAE